MPNDVYSVRESTGERVDPSTEIGQVELLRELQKQELATNDVKYQVLTLTAAEVGTPEVGHGCKKVYYWTALSDCYVGDADSQPVLLIASKDYGRPINSVTNLRFVSVTGGNVYIESFN